MPTPLDEITTQITALETRASELLATAEADTSKVAEVKGLVETEIQPKLDILFADRERAVASEEFKSLGETVSTLQKTIADLRKPSDGFVLAASAPEGKAALFANDPYAADPMGSKEFSPYVDIMMAKKGSAAARERLTYAFDRYPDIRFNAEGKAMTEGTGAQGGYLVQPELERQLILAREKDNVLRPLCSSLTVNTNAIQLDQLGISTSAGWVAELATKPESTAMTIATVTASIFTAAGLATISNQLLADSNPAVDQLVTQDLAKRIVALEESAFMNGTGTGQPLGILNTSGVNTQTITNTEDPSVEGGLLDNILEAIATTQLAWGQPSAIVMHPRTWTRIIKSRDSVGHYTISPRNIFTAGYDPATPRTFVDGPEQTLFGVQVVLSNRVPTNLGTGTNESRVIVGDFQEALILDRQGLQIDESEHVYFTTNQTVFRAEARVGFTAARSAKAFTVIGGSGLANG
jgi:HK97 family phage major capsid protein